MAVGSVGSGGGIVQVDGAWASLQAIRQRSPLIHNMINLVAMDLAANVLLATGASPAMVQGAEEVEDFVARADALTINIGTLTSAVVEPMVAAARGAVEHGKPWVLDPVGVGATEVRREVAERLAGLQPTVIRGNGSEIMTLGGGTANRGQGVDSTLDSTEALDAARDLAKATGAVVAVTGVVDYVTDGEAIVAVANGHPLMTRVTALGCALTCFIGACLAVTEEPLQATADGLAVFGVAGEIAAAESLGPASFRQRFIDTLYNLDEATLTSTASVQ
jgi:hydroxyethylthiazole kinase